MQDFAHTLDTNRGGKKSKLFVPQENPIILPGDTAYNDQEAQDRIEYNQKINEHLEEYTSFKPLRKVIVRCYLMEAFDQNGVWIKPEIEVHVKTSNGMGIKDTVYSPYPYSRKAVVVAVPEGMASLSVGDEVLLERGVVLSMKANENTPFHLPKAFTASSWFDLEPPTNMKSPHYGYLIVEPNTEILGITSKNTD